MSRSDTDRLCPGEHFHLRQRFVWQMFSIEDSIPAVVSNKAAAFRGADRMMFLAR